jgi:hypothetical protein
MKRRPVHFFVLAGAAAACPALADPDWVTWHDPAGDAVLRRTDPGADGQIVPGCTLPDMVSVTLAAWEAFDAKADPYTGIVVDADDAHLLRLDVVFRGVICPPGPLGLNGEDYEPNRFGPSPVYGFLDIDIDDRKDTGGVLGGAARQRYLANIARFGRIPGTSLGERAARSADDYDDNFFTGRQYERTGADWNLAFCGCFITTIITEQGDGDGIFGEDETWIVRGRFFERSTGYVEASDAFGGSGFGHYDPRVNLRFSHESGTDLTTVTLVFALDMAGAAALTGQNEEDVDLNVQNHTSIVEGLQDIIDKAGNLSGPVAELTEGWDGRDPYDYLDPSRWEVLALFGTAYASPEGSLFAWTDTGFDEVHGDVNGDGIADSQDLALIIDHVYKNDGTLGDSDGAKDGRVLIPGFGLNFSLYDLNGDGWVDGQDLWAYGHRADLNRDGSLDIFDFLTFQNLFLARNPEADFNLDGVFDIFDFLGFVNAFNQ